MDVFHQNWNQHMKENMFVNKILSTKNDPMIKFHRRLRRPSHRHIQNPENYFKNGKFYKVAYIPYTPEKWKKMSKIKNEFHAVSDSLQEISMRSRHSADLGYNTRPQSLYNLHYASIRN